MKYPRTPHLPWSPGGTSDDRRLLDVSSLVGRPLIVTEKADGSNTCLEKDNCFARSHGAAPDHPSFSAFKALHASVRHLIPKSLQVFGEWCWAKHTIPYDRLPGYFMVFGVRDLGTNLWASWEEVCLWAEELGLPTVAVLASVQYGRVREMEVALKAPPPTSRYGTQGPEGFVVRVAEGFRDEDFGISVAKWVRKNHVQTDDHWKNQQIVRNGLAV